MILRKYGLWERDNSILYPFIFVAVWNYEETGLLLLMDRLETKFFYGGFLVTDGAVLEVWKMFGTTFYRQQAFASLLFYFGDEEE